VQYLLDTCVLSDAASPPAHSALAAWLSKQSDDDCVISVLTIGELRYGVERLPRGRKRETLKYWIDDELVPKFSGRVLDVDLDVADAWAQLRSLGDETGRPLPVIDGLLLATAQVNGLTFVTRNLKDVDGRGVAVLSPY
jgi:predicted nucleic acid-binding protein